MDILADAVVEAVRWYRTDTPGYLIKSCDAGFYFGEKSKSYSSADESLIICDQRDLFKGTVAQRGGERRF